MREETDIGVLGFGGNEQSIDSKIDDPPKVRGGRPTPGALFVIAGDFLIADPTTEEPDHMRRIEAAQIQLTGDPASGGGVRILALIPGASGADDEMRPLLEISHAGIVAHVPIVPLAGISQSPIPPPPPPTVPGDLQRWVDAILAEFATTGMEIDPKNVQAVREGRTPLKEFHDDLATRAGGHDQNAHPPGAPY